MTTKPIRYLRMEICPESWLCDWISRRIVPPECAVYVAGL
jgi:hypothetical protein